MMLEAWVLLHDQPLETLGSGIHTSAAAADGSAEFGAVEFADFAVGTGTEGSRPAQTIQPQARYWMVLEWDVEEWQFDQQMPLTS